MGSRWGEEAARWSSAFRVQVVERGGVFVDESGRVRTAGGLLVGVSKVVSHVGRVDHSVDSVPAPLQILLLTRAPRRVTAGRRGQRQGAVSGIDRSNCSLTRGPAPALSPLNPRASRGAGCGGCLECAEVSHAAQALRRVPAEDVGRGLELGVARLPVKIELDLSPDNDVFDERGQELTQSSTQTMK